MKALKPLLAIPLAVILVSGWIPWQEDSEISAKQKVQALICASLQRNYTIAMSAAQLADAVQRLSPEEHAKFLDALLGFDANAIRQRLEDMTDLREAEDALATETEWTPWETVKAELNELHG